MTGKKQIIRLNTNENYYGCSGAVIPVMEKKLELVNQYPDMPFRLEKKLAEKYGLSEEQVITGAGSVRIIDGIIQSLVKPDEEILSFDRSFIAYEQLADAHYRKLIKVKQTDFICWPENLSTHISPKTRVIFLANPNNPTGTIISHEELDLFMQKLSPEIYLVLDEAYCEYVSDSSYPDALALLKKYKNLIVLRSFSKIYGLAGLRIGYGFMNANLANQMKAKRIPFFLNYLAEDAALAALEDEKFIQICAEKNAIERVWLTDALQKKGYHVISSQANFLFVYFEDEDQKDKIHQKLSSEGLITCNLTSFNQNNSIRIGLADREVNEMVVRVLV
ncbi:MAG: histidinol-phosphate transaminase [Crocinitomicaceae bacterium]|nr:histidinol-phosphate transaminase [Crocinitomicaceae bacterium]